MLVAPGSEATADIMAKTWCYCCHFDKNWTTSSAQHHTSRTQRHHAFCLMLFLFYSGVLANSGLPSGGILSETLEWFYGLGTVTRASIDILVKWVKFQI